ncbi:uncharacterized protein F5Z01DRAFT_208741 [Emericellopsis atlantica]|uniref:Zn(2)-C6 fungal-type domain-containing protein n=1 Tax=Emericellopsis atlantica TaxID=2614577 RepID=A0A9P7ZVS2_9HYPO|nr:uncharacterized protein F5Z01DRAFT_208741 [Emericellopsis atlantica]KAG9258632.1 hypothetical protein F5Z01DRAFT_208741 [Emericellopsis atlantica]
MNGPFDHCYMAPWCHFHDLSLHPSLFGIYAQVHPLSPLVFSLTSITRKHDMKQTHFIFSQSPSRRSFYRMDQMEDSHDNPSRRHVQHACVACRATKIRCQPSEQPGVCRKCLESKRECVARTGPRTRRPKRSKNSPEAGPTHEPGPSSTQAQTFTIDFAVPAPDEQDDSFSSLAQTHEQALAALFTEHEEEQDFMLPLSPPSSSATPASHPVESLTGQPQFNLASASSLLDIFRTHMLPNFPCVTLSETDTVAEMATRQPFVLLAILASVSASGNMLQGHGLYDSEFRKVLALKFVAGGERTLEILQGILIYCAWYPFHLRPKNKQAYHYLRMASDLLHDLELDNEPAFYQPEDFLLQAGVRAYLSYTYLAASFLIGWRRYKGIYASFDTWTEKACSLLETNTHVSGDKTLVALVRLSSIIISRIDVDGKKSTYTEADKHLLLLGLEAKLDSLHIAHETTTKNAQDPVVLTHLFAKIYLIAAPFLTLPPTPKSPSPPNMSYIIAPLATALTTLASLSDEALRAFTAPDWFRLIVCVIVASKLSFPLANDPSWDDASARSALRLGSFLDSFCQDDNDDGDKAKTKNDVLSASRVVMRMVRDKFNRKLHTAAGAKRTASLGCPMLDGSLDNYMPMWDPPPLPLPPQTSQQQSGPVFHDLWATMTMSWSNGRGPCP